VYNSVDFLCCQRISWNACPHLSVRFGSIFTHTQERIYAFLGAVCAFLGTPREKIARIHAGYRPIEPDMYWYLRVFLLRIKTW